MSLYVCVMCVAYTYICDWLPFLTPRPNGTNKTFSKNAVVFEIVDKPCVKCGMKQYHMMATLRKCMPIANTCVIVNDSV